jgi:hypothetical protein
LHGFAGNAVEVLRGADVCRGVEFAEGEQAPREVIREGHRRRLLISNGGVRVGSNSDFAGGREVKVVVRRRFRHRRPPRIVPSRIRQQGEFGRRQRSRQRHPFGVPDVPREALQSVVNSPFDNRG